MKYIYFNHIPGSIHPVYQEILANPPDGYCFMNKDNFQKNYQDLGIDRGSKDMFQILKNFFLNFLKKYYFLPNITFNKLPGDIIYSCQSIVLFGDYILDLDCYESLNRFSNRISLNFFNKFIVRILLNRKNCHKILFWSENAKIGFQAYFGDEFNSKIEVLYPAIYTPNKFEKTIASKSQDRVNILFVGKKFFDRKGGELLLSIADDLISKYTNVYFTFVTQVGDEILLKYKENPQIVFSNLVSREKVMEYFKESHIYVMPTFQDIFGMVYLEAFAYGLVPVGLNTFAVGNIISDGVDGFLIEYKNKFYNSHFQYIDKYNLHMEVLLDKIKFEEFSEIKEKLKEKIEILICNKELRCKLSRKGFQKVSDGIFSLEHRNNIFKKIIENI